MCEDFTQSTMAGIFATEVDPIKNYFSRYCSMQLNYHEGEYLSSLGDTLFGGYWNDADVGGIHDGGGLFYLWHNNDTTTHVFFGSLSQ